MKTLIDALLVYALENLTPRFQKETATETRAAWCRVDQLADQLNALGPEAEEWMEALKDAQATIDHNHERATLLAGISIGLELGRL